MHFSTTTVLALLSSPFLALAQSGSRPNAFIVPKEGLSAVGGEPVTLEWNPTTEGTVSLVLRSGSASNLEEGTVIAEGIDNSGSFEWTPSNDLTRGSDYTVQIVDDEDPSNTNYTPYFYLDTDTTVAQVTSTVSLGAPSSAPDASTASPTGDATSLTDVETLATTAAETTVTDSAASTATVQSTETMTTGGSMTTGSDSMETSASSSAAEESASASESADAAEQSDNAGTRNAAMAGMLGVVALGAFAL